MNDKKENLTSIILEMKNTIENLSNIIKIVINSENKIEYSNALIGMSYSTASLESIFRDLCLYLPEDLDSENLNSSDNTNPIGFNTCENKNN